MLLVEAPMEKSLAKERQGFEAGGMNDAVGSIRVLRRHDNPFFDPIEWMVSRNVLVIKVHL